MGNSEHYESGHSRGWNRANFGVAYENVARYSEPAEPVEYPSNVKTDRDRWDFESGFEAGWNQFMNEDYPE